MISIFVVGGQNRGQLLLSTLIRNTYVLRTDNFYTLLAILIYPPSSEHKKSELKNKQNISVMTHSDIFT